VSAAKRVAQIAALVLCAAPALYVLSQPGRRCQGGVLVQINPRPFDEYDLSVSFPGYTNRCHLGRNGADAKSPICRDPRGVTYSGAGVIFPLAPGKIEIELAHAGAVLRAGSYVPLGDTGAERCAPAVVVVDGSRG